MDNMELISFGVFYIVIGLVLIIRKKIVVKKEHRNIFFLCIILAPFIINSTELVFYEKNLIIFIIFINILVIVPLTIFGINTGRNTYEIINVNTQSVVLAITNILKEKNIPYEEKDKAILLKDYDDKSIGYKKALDTVSIDFKSIKELSFYEEIKEELISKIKGIKIRVFPTSGFLFIVFGMILLLAGKYLI